MDVVVQRTLANAHHNKYKYKCTHTQTAQAQNNCQLWGTLHPQFDDSKPSPPIGGGSQAKRLNSGGTPDSRVRSADDLRRVEGHLVQAVEFGPIEVGHSRLWVNVHARGE